MQIAQLKSWHFIILQNLRSSIVNFIFSGLDINILTCKNMFCLMSRSTFCTCPTSPNATCKNKVSLILSVTLPVKK